MNTTITFKISRKTQPCHALNCNTDGSKESVIVEGYAVTGFPIDLYIRKDTKALCGTTSGVVFYSPLDCHVSMKAIVQNAIEKYQRCITETQLLNALECIGYTRTEAAAFAQYIYQ